MWRRLVALPLLAGLVVGCAELDTQATRIAAIETAVAVTPTQVPTPTSPEGVEERLSALEADIQNLLTLDQTPRLAAQSADLEFQNVIAAVSLMMMFNRLFSLPNPSALTTGNGTGGCDTGTSLMTAFPDGTSVAASMDKLNDPYDDSYNNRVDPKGDLDGYLLFGHDIIGNTSQAALVNYMSVANTAFCYQSTADGTITQYSPDGTQTNP